MDLVCLDEAIGVSAAGQTTSYYWDVGSYTYTNIFALDLSPKILNRFTLTRDENKSWQTRDRKGGSCCIHT
jgi:hypothetical protein